MNHTRWITLLLILAVSAAFAQTPVRDHDIVYEDYFSQAFIQTVAASPDGQNIAYVEWRWDQQKDGRNRNLWVVNVKTKETLRLTSDVGNEVSPQWSPDNQTIYFVGHYKIEGEENPPSDGSAQIWKIRLDGTELKAVTQLDGGIDDYRISEDGSTLYYTVSKDDLIGEWKDLRSEYQGDLEFGHGINTVSEIWKLNLTTWRTEKIVDEKRYIGYFEVSPDQSRIGMITDVNDLLINHEGWSEVEIYDAETGKVTILDSAPWRNGAPSPYGWLGSPAWSSDSKIFAFSIDYDGYPMQLFTVKFDKSGKTAVRELRKPDGVSAMGGFHWYPGKEVLCFIGDYQARAHVYSIDYNTGKTDNLTPGDVVVDAYDFAGPKGALIANQNTLTYYGDLALYNKGKSERITRVNPQVDTWKLPQISLVEWKGANGDLVQGVLELPPDYDGNSKLPLIVNLHGGPTMSEHYCFLFWIYGRTALAAKGYAVLCPNYRGSTGYGDKFMTDLIGHENNIDVEDIMTGVDAMIERGIADPERLGVMGWSNGGFLTNCLIPTNRFKAASTGAGVLDMTMQWGEEDTPGHVVNFMQGLPWENPESYRKGSPVYNLKKDLQTAVLIHVGGGDERVPASNSKALHRALYHYLEVPCELVVYPGQGHGLSTYTYRLAKMKWDHAWFDKYLPAD